MLPRVVKVNLKKKMIPWSFPYGKYLFVLKLHTFFLKFKSNIGRHLSVIAKIAASPQSSSTLIFGFLVVP